jgi:hypothetical protein
MEVACAKGCGHNLTVDKDTLREMIELGQPMVVAHEVCPTDQPPEAQHEYRMKVTVYRDGEKVASMGDTKVGAKWDDVVVALGAELQAQWERIVGMGDLIDEDPADDVQPPVCRNCGTQVPDTEPQYFYCNSECEREDTNDA